MDLQEAWVRGNSISEMARTTGRDRKTVRRLLRESGARPRAAREVSSKLDPFRAYLLERVLGEDPVSNSEVLLDEIRAQGYSGGRSILKEFCSPRGGRRRAQAVEKSRNGMLPPVKASAIIHIHVRPLSRLNPGAQLESREPPPGAPHRPARS